METEKLDERRSGERKDRKENGRKLKRKGRRGGVWEGGRRRRVKKETEDRLNKER